jgi:type IV secretion system protein VirB9
VRLIVASALLMLSPAPVSAATPSPHIKTVLWSPDSVVEIRGAPGWQVMIEFGEDERMENISIGDSRGWQVTPNKRARHLFLKPLSVRASTNLTVVTDKRRYAFALSAGPRLATTPWIVRFDYPRPVIEAREEPPPPPPPVYNLGYAVRGDEGLRPARIWDDGRQTFFAFEAGQPIPAIFADGPGKTETLVNSVVQGRVVIVQQLHPRFTARIGERTAVIERVEAQNR